MSLTLKVYLYWSISMSLFGIRKYDYCGHLLISLGDLFRARAVALYSYGSPPRTQFWELHNVAVKQWWRHTSWPMAAKAHAPSSSEHLSRRISMGIFLSWAAQPSPLALLLPTVASGHSYSTLTLGFWPYPAPATLHPTLMAALACCSQALSWATSGPAAWNRTLPQHTHTHTPPCWLKLRSVPFSRMGGTVFDWVTTLYRPLWIAEKKIKLTGEFIKWSLSLKNWRSSRSGRTITERQTHTLQETLRRTLSHVFISQMRD